MRFLDHIASAEELPGMDTSTPDLTGRRKSGWR